MHIFTCVYQNTCHLCVYILGGQNASFLGSNHLMSRQGFSLTWDLPKILNLLVSAPYGSFCLWFSSNDFSIKHSYNCLIYICVDIKGSSCVLGIFYKLTYHYSTLLFITFLLSFPIQPQETNELTLSFSFYLFHITV